MFSINKNIKLASNAGFCYGVKRAVETTKDLKQKNPDKNIFVLGELIHNSQVISELDSLGIKTVDSLPCDECGICIIRSHGASYELINEIKDKGFDTCDLTCPDVKKVQNMAVELVSEDYFLIILGEPTHPEVVAICSNARASAKDKDKVCVIKTADEIDTIKETIKSQKRVGVVVQTTQRIEFLNNVVQKLIPVAKDLRVINTICASTAKRQEEAKELAQVSDLMVVVGSKKSANTTHLAEILTDISKTIHIETDSELNEYASIIDKSQNIGVTAGASTPDYIINKVINKLSKGDK